MPSKNVHFMSRSVEYETPDWLFRALQAEFGFTLDPACTHENAKCKKHFTKEQDGLRQDWAGHSVFLNPPYGREIGKWVSKAHQSSLAGALVVCLLPARTDTRWWHDNVTRGEIRFLRGCLRFGNATNSAPFPSAIVIFRPPRTY